MNCCLNCGNEIPLPGYIKHRELSIYRALKFCSKRCSAQYQGNRRRVLKICIGCGEQTVKSTNKYCSHDCYIRHGVRKQRPEKHCEFCDLLIVDESWGGASRLRYRRFCNQYCYRQSIKAPRDEKTCACCGKTYARRGQNIKWFVQSKFCSKVCQGLGTRGIASASFKEEITGYRKTTVNGKSAPAHKHVAESVLKRELDDSELVHHINLKKTDNDPKNLLVLTKSNHSWLHHELGRRYMEERNGVLPDDLLALGIWLGGISPKS